MEKKRKDKLSEIDSQGRGRRITDLQGSEVWCLDQFGGDGAGDFGPGNVAAEEDLFGET